MAHAQRVFERPQERSKNAGRTTYHNLVRSVDEAAIPTDDGVLGWLLDTEEGRGDGRW
jgi:hypothetical protein